MLRGVAWIAAMLTLGIVLSVTFMSSLSATLAIATGAVVVVLALALARVDVRYAAALVVFCPLCFCGAAMSLGEELAPRGWCGTGRMMALQTLATLALGGLAIALVAVRLLKNRSFFPALARYSAVLATLLGVYVSVRALAVSQRPSIERYWASQEELGRLPLLVDGHSVKFVPEEKTGPDTQDKRCILDVDGVRSGVSYKDTSGTADAPVGCPGAHATRLGDIVVVHTDGHQELPVRLHAPGATSIVARDLAGHVAAPAPWTTFGCIGTALAIAAVVVATIKRRALRALGAPREGTVDDNHLVHVPGLAPIPSPPSTRGTRPAAGPITVWLSSRANPTYRAQATAVIVQAAEGSIVDVLAKHEENMCYLHISAVLGVALSTGPLWAAHLQSLL